ncbi:MAG: hypothetical protein MMC23_007458 [Stictis urceolatum]|nr:hypothetical protein [Stictis urceolata]
MPTFLPQYPPSRLRSFLLDILFLLATLIFLGALLNALFIRRRDRLRRQQWDEYWADEFSHDPAHRDAGSAIGTRFGGGRIAYADEEGYLDREGAGVMRMEEEDAPPGYGEDDRSGVRAVPVGVEVGERDSERPPGYEEATKGDPVERRNDNGGRA